MEKAKSLEEKQSAKYNLINYINKPKRENWFKTTETIDINTPVDMHGKH